MKGLCNLSGGGGSNEIKATKLGMWTADYSTTFTFSDKYDYAFVSGSVGRDGHNNKGLTISSSGCEYIDFGESYYPTNDRSCECGIASRLLIKPTSGTVARVTSNMSGARVGISVIGIKVGGGIVNLLKRLFTRNEVIA